MSSRGKKKTTMAKLNREARLRQRRDDKQARKQARREAAVASPVEETVHALAEGDRPHADGIEEELL
jgi:hypothetical protein